MPCVHTTHTPRKRHGPRGSTVQPSTLTLAPTLPLTNSHPHLSSPSPLTLQGSRGLRAASTAACSTGNTGRRSSLARAAAQSTFAGAAESWRAVAAMPPRATSATGAAARCARRHTHSMCTVDTRCMRASTSFGMAAARQRSVYYACTMPASTRGLLCPQAALGLEQTGGMLTFTDGGGQRQTEAVGGSVWAAARSSCPAKSVDALMVHTPCAHHASAMRMPRMCHG